MICPECKTGYLYYDEERTVILSHDIVSIENDRIICIDKPIITRSGFSDTENWIECTNCDLELEVPQRVEWRYKK